MINNLWENMSTDDEYEVWNCSSSNNACTDETEMLSALPHTATDSTMLNVCHSPDKSNEMSFYDNTPVSSPRRPCSISPSSYMDMSMLSNENSPSSSEIVSHSFIGVNFDSVDSGCDGSNSSRKCFKFIEPSGTAPKRIDTNSPKALTAIQNRRATPRKSESCFRPINSLTDSTDSGDEDYMEFLGVETIDDRDTLPPTNFDSVLVGNFKRPALRRVLSLDDSTNNADRIKNNSVKNESFKEMSPSFLCRPFKRSDTSMCSPVNSKRWKSEVDEKENRIERPILQKSQSMIESSSNINIKKALAKDDFNLIGDFSKPFCLPILKGNHCDLKYISAETLAGLLKGEFATTVESFRIVDCRYPYEYNGGHIRGAENMFTHDDIIRTFMSAKTETATVETDQPKRRIIIFHCEFSSERGPKLLRFLRTKDRTLNSNTYPALHYPEVYLLQGGYKEFFRHHSELCDPVQYVPMLEPSFETAFRQFRAQTKSWNGDKLTMTSRSGKSRSRLIL